MQINRLLFKKCLRKRPVTERNVATGSTLMTDLERASSGLIYRPSKHIFMPVRLSDNNA